MKILYLHDAGFTPGMQHVLRDYAKKAQIDFALFQFANLTHGMATQPTKTKLVANPVHKKAFFAKLLQAIATTQPKIIVINDWVALEYITTTYRSLDTTRGGIYFINGIPALVLDSFRTAGGMAKLKAVPHAGWLLLQDLKKLKRWHSGTQRTEPVFDYETVDTVEAFRRFEADYSKSVLIGMDVETSGRGTGCIITCSGYALLQRDGRILSRTVPLINPINENGAQWRDAKDFETILAGLRALHQLPIPKVMQNGTYDAHHYVRYNMPPSHYLFDTANAFHALWPEAPKRLDFISSIAWDHYRFWKDENKADEKDDNQTDRVPDTADGWFRYLRYCGLDCHYTLGSAVYLLSILRSVPWAMENYRQSFRQSVGPGLAMSLRGVRVSKTIQTGFEYQNIAKSEKAKKDMALMTPGMDFNPNSPPQVAQLVYDVCKATPLPKRGAKKNKSKTGKASPNHSTNEKDLEIITTQHPLLDVIIHQIWECKKPANNASKYGKNGLRLMNDRWMYKLSPIGTETGRYSCKDSDFWVGTQIQNVPYEMRPMVEPDPGYVLFDFDYSKADFWHTAFASGEKEMIKVASDAELDVHCFHASKFFSKPYEEIYRGYKKKESWVVDSLHGVRQNAKRIVYGANYLMGGYTLFTTMGKKAVDATAKAMGRNTAGWSITDYASFCQSLLDFYFERMYPGLLSWLEQTVSAVSRRGNLAVSCGGRTRSFFADLITDKSAQRELAAFYGQGGTACTINAVLDNIYYSGFDNQDLMLLFQVHDSVVGQVREDKLHLLKELRQLMMITNKINEFSFVIPAEGSVGYGWGYRMTDWHESITLDEIRKADEKWRSKNTSLLSSSSQDMHELEKIRSLVI